MLKKFLGLFLLASSLGLAQTAGTGPKAGTSSLAGGGGGSGISITGIPAANQVTLWNSATSITGDAGLTYSGTGATFKLGIGTDVYLSRASAGLLLVEDGSGAARDVQARTGTFGTSVVTPVVSGATTTTTLTESSATSFATLTYAASTVAGVEMLCRVRANDATDFQVLTSRIRISTVRKSTGNTISTIGVVGTDLLAESAGGSTLTCTFSVVEGASAATVQASCVSSLTQTTLNISFLAETVGPVAVAQL